MIVLGSRNITCMASAHVDDDRQRDPISEKPAKRPAIMSDDTECSICRDAFVNPRLLPCNHVVCLACLMDVERVARKDNKAAVCPLCRVPLGALATELPVATDVPVAQPVRALMVGGAAAAAVPNAVTSPMAVPCMKHPGQCVFAFCDQDEILVCPECFKPGGLHHEHTLLSFNEAGVKFAAFTVLYPPATKLKERIALVDAATAELNALGAKLNARLFAITNDITATFFELTQQRPADTAVLEARRDALLQRARTELEADIKTNALHIEGLKIAKDQLVVACRQVDAMISRFDTPVLDGLRLHTIVAARLRQLSGQDPVLKPLVEDSLRFSFPNPVPPEIPLDHLGSIVR